MQTAPDSPRHPARSPCPISSTLDLVGDKWSLLVIRDLLSGKETYNQLLQSPEGISTNLLADRLKRLQRAGLITRSRYRERPVRYSYRPTAEGRALAPVLSAMADWGQQHIQGTAARIRFS